MPYAMCDPLLRSPPRQTAECLHTMAMIQQAESPQVGDTALGSQNMALEVSRHIGHIRAGRRGCWRLFRQSREAYLVVL